MKWVSYSRNSNGIMMTEYNPNYEFAGGTCTIQDLREVDRDNLLLVKYVINASIPLIFTEMRYVIYFVKGFGSRSLRRGVSGDAEE